MSEGAVVVDLRALQSPDHRGRGIARWAQELASALERVRPDLVGAYLLDAGWPPPASVERLISRDKVCYGGTARAEAAVAGASVYYCASPFELTRTIADMRPPAVDRFGLRYAATAYDLIPLLWQDLYLAGPSGRRRYHARLEVLRSADAVLAISSAAARDVTRLVGVRADRCVVVGTGVPAQFVPPVTRGEALAALRAEVPALTDPFVLFPGGSDPRKNAERLVAAFAMLPPELVRGFQLVFAGDFPADLATHYLHLADTLGAAGRLVLSGYVPEETLVRLYQSAALVVFPSLFEGFGLPVAEAMGCGAVACVSDRPPLDELVLDARARFDPEDPRDMAACMARCLTDPGVRRAVRQDAGSTVESWDTVARRAAAAFERLAGEHRRPWRRRTRSRVAVLSPFPPMQSGVAGYSASLVDSMMKVAGGRVEIDCFIDGRNRYPVEPQPVSGRMPRDAAIFERVDGAIGGYDQVVYVLGNSEFHANALAALRRRPGTVLTHEVRLSGLLALSSGTRGAVPPGGLPAAIERNYPGLPAGLGRGDVVTPVDAERYGLFLLKDVASDADKVLVCSESARKLALLDVGPELAERIAVVPFAVTYRAEVATAVEDVGSRPPADSAPLVATFGIVDPSKRPETVIEAVGILTRRGVDVRGALVGPVSEELRETLGSLVGSLGIADRMTLTGEVSPARYRQLLGEAALAVQLRARTAGECSATVSECLSAGLPTVVTRIGWMGEIPRTAVVAVSPVCGPEELADELAALLDTAARREDLGRGGRHWAARHTFEDSAIALLEALGLG